MAARSRQPLEGEDEPTVAAGPLAGALSNITAHGTPTPPLESSTEINPF